MTERRLPEPTHWRPSWRYRLLSRAQQIVAWLVERTPVGGSRLVDIYMRLDDARARCP